MKRLTSKQLREKVKITCYNKTETMIREEAIEFYREGVMCCDGCEKERYMNILLQLLDGEKVCSDREC